MHGIERQNLKQAVLANAEAWLAHMEREMTAKISRPNEPRPDWKRHKLEKIAEMKTAMADRAQPKPPGRTRAKPPVYYLYGAYDKLSQYVTNRAIKVADDFPTAGISRSDIPSIPVGHTFPEGIYAFDVPPWSGKVHETALLRAAYGVSESAKGFMNFETFVAFVPDIWNWKETGYYDFLADSSQIIPGSDIVQMVKTPQRDQSPVPSQPVAPRKTISYQFTDHSGTTPRKHMPVAIIAFGKTRLGEGAPPVQPVTTVQLKPSNAPQGFSLQIFPPPPTPPSSKL